MHVICLSVSLSLTSRGSVLTCPFMSPVYNLKWLSPHGRKWDIYNCNWHWSYIESWALGAGNSAISRHSSRFVWSLCCLSQEVERKNLCILNASLTPSFSRQQFPLWNLWFQFQTRHSWRQVQIGQSLVKMPTCLSCEHWVRAESCRAGTEHITRSQHLSRAVSFSKEVHTEETWLLISTPGSKKLVFTLWVLLWAPHLRLNSQGPSVIRGSRAAALWWNLSDSSHTDSACGFLSE